ncbi:MAG: HAD family hydrolase [Bacteroidales bacterium OttesenSCG-928-I14]|jgi:putative hydrolase of the HAD superfamily|nr:HAD family hydrolase [Bacteroidales bacterium OttesenSCG-928-I14]
MIDLNMIEGIIFDYGATIDANGKHWSEIIWDAYKNNHVPISKNFFLESYMFVEHYLTTNQVIKSEYTFKEVLLKKVDLQIRWLINKGVLKNDNYSMQYPLIISNQCYDFVISVLLEVIPVLKNLVSNYPLVLVTNFYGNIEAVLKDFGLNSFFKKIIESAKVKIRKPNPFIFTLGVKALDLNPGGIVVIGDSYKNDILPAQIIGCKTIWIQNVFEKKELKNTANVIIHDFKELDTIFKQKN